MKRKVLFLVIAMFILSGIIYYLVNKNNKSTDISIKIGSTLPLTGNSAVWGIPTKEGIELAMNLYNKKGGFNGKKIEVLFQDTKADPKTGVNAIHELIYNSGVKAIIDNSNSAVTLAMAPIANKNKVVLLPTGSSSPDITHAGQYIFRIWNSDALEGEIMADFIFNNEKVDTISILAVNNSYGIGLKDAFLKKYISNGGKVLNTEYFNEKETNFETIISKVIQKKPKGIYIICYPKQGALILKQLKNYNNKSKLYGAVAFEDNNLLDLAGDAANGIKFPLPAPVDTTNVVYENFKKNFHKLFHKKVPFLAAEGFDGFNIIMKAIEIADDYKSGEKIKNALHKIKNYNGVSGIIEFDKNGDVHKPYGIRIIENNKFKWFLTSYNDK